MTVEAKKNILLFGNTSKLSLNILYCLRNAAFNIHYLSNNSKNAAKFSKFIISYEIVKNNSWNLDEIISLIISRKIDVLMPVGESEVLFIEQNKTELEKYCKCQWVTSAANFNIAINKNLLAGVLEKMGVLVPLHVSINSKEDIIKFTSTVGFPVLIKPTRSSFGWGIKKFNSLNPLLNYFEKNKLYQKEYILQQFIIGSDINCNVFCEHGEVICHTIQESPVRYGVNFSPHDTIAFGPDEEVISEVRKVMRKFNWHGVANIDIRRDHRTKKFYILEINGRYWGSVIASLARAGMNFPDIAAHYALGNRIPIAVMHEGLQISVKKFLKSLISLKPYSFNKTKFHSYGADAKARLMQMIEKIR